MLRLQSVFMRLFGTAVVLFAVAFLAPSAGLLTNTDDQDTQFPGLRIEQEHRSIITEASLIASGTLF